MHRRGCALRRRYGRAMAAAPTTPEFEAALSAFLSSAQRMIDEHDDKTFVGSRGATGDARFGARKLTIERGPRYIRVVVSDVNGPARSVYCFIDTKDGSILKAASWKTPAKHARGSLFAADPMQAVTQYGGKYLR
jgi:hypothetical protein